MSLKLKDGIILGLALFAMFFGAGNLIFPTSVGLISGSQWIPAMIGFLVTGVGLPLLGVFAVIKIGGSLKEFARSLGKKFSVVYGVIIITSLALVAVSRTAATTYEMSIAPLFPNVSPVLSSIVFFIITFLLVFNPNGIIDRIGKILTPILLVMLTVIIVKGVIEPIGAPATVENVSMFTTGFFGGYQTMDALGSVMLGGIISASMLQKGYNKKEDQRKVASIAIVIAGLGLAIVYGGLLYLGSTSSNVLTSELSRTELTISIVSLILGRVGKVILGICVAFACMTTSVGLTATVGDFYEDLTNKRVSYKIIVSITCILCALISNIGVDMIVTLATPLLIMIYPVTILLIVLNLMNTSYYVIRGGVIGALCITIFEGLNATSFSIGYINELISQLPLAEQGFPWLIPALTGIAIGFMIEKVINRQKKVDKNRGVYSV